MQFNYIGVQPRVWHRSVVSLSSIKNANFAQKLENKTIQNQTHQFAQCCNEHCRLVQMLWIPFPELKPFGHRVVRPKELHNCHHLAHAQSSNQQAASLVARRKQY